PFAVKACQCSGTFSKTFSASLAESKRANTQEPVPVIRGMAAYCANHASACATGGYIFFTTGSQMLLPSPARKPAIVMGSQSRVNCVAENISAVDTAHSGKITKYQGSAGLILVNISPTPSAQVA